MTDGCACYSCSEARREASIHARADKYDDALAEIALHLTKGNQNVVDGDLVACIRDLACRCPEPEPEDKSADGYFRPADVNGELLSACRLALNAFERNDCIDWGVIESAIANAEGAK